METARRFADVPHENTQLHPHPQRGAAEAQEGAEVNEARLSSVLRTSGGMHNALTQ